MKIRNIAIAGLAILMLLTLAGCGKTTEIEKLFHKGYTVTMVSANEEAIGVILQKDGSLDRVYMARGSMKPAEYAVYTEMMESEHADAELVEYLCGRSKLVVEDITESIPTQEKLNEYVGKTFEYLEHNFYESSGWVGEAGNYVFSYDGPLFCLNVTPAAGTMTGDIDDYSANDIRALEIGKVEFAGFSFSIFDRYTDFQIIPD